MTAPAQDFAVAAISEDVARYVREHGRDPIWGHATVTQTATGFGPCRMCLNTFREGEEQRTLFTHDTYAGVADFPQPGPVYIHAASCETYDGDAFPPGLRGLELTFEAVAPGPRVIALERSVGGDAERVIGCLLELPDVEYVNVRNTEAGCFVARAVPAETPPRRGSA
jgi:Protein of unknown function (DUF1203)